MKTEKEIIKNAIEAINCAGLQIEVLESIRNGQKKLETSISTKEILLKSKADLKELLETK